MEDYAAWGLVVLVDPCGAETVVGVVGGPGHPDLEVVDLLARRLLDARRAGGRLEVRQMADDLAGLLELVGLLREMVRQPEGREQPLGVEKGVEPDDPAP